MIIGVPKEVKDYETRVGLVPSGVVALHEAGNEVLVETRAGERSAITDREYMQAARASCRRLQIGCFFWFVIRNAGELGSEGVHTPEPSRI